MPPSPTARNTSVYFPHLAMWATNIPPSPTVFPPSRRTGRGDSVRRIVRGADAQVHVKRQLGLFASGGAAGGGWVVGGIFREAQAERTRSNAAVVIIHSSNQSREMQKPAIKSAKVWAREISESDLQILSSLRSSRTRPSFHWKAPWIY